MADQSSDLRLCNRLRQARASCGLTQAGLAERVGVSRKTVNTIENGVFIPSLLLGFRFAEALGSNVEALFYVER